MVIGTEPVGAVTSGFEDGRVISNTTAPAIAAPPNAAIRTSHMGDQRAARGEDAPRATSCWRF